MMNNSILYHWDFQYRIRNAIYDAPLIANKYL